MKKIILLSVFFIVFAFVIGVKISSAADNGYLLPNESSLSYAFKNNNLVYLTLSPVGLGGYILSPIYTKLLELNTENKKITSIVPESFHSYSFFKPSNILVYVPNSADSNNINILSIKNRKVTFSYRLPDEIGSNGQITAIKMSNDGKNILFIIGYGPDNEHSVFYSFNVKTKKLTKIKTVTGIVYKF